MQASDWPSLLGLVGLINLMCFASMTIEHLPRQLLAPAFLSMSHFSSPLGSGNNWERKALMKGDSSRFVFPLYPVKGYRFPSSKGELTHLKYKIVFITIYGSIQVFYKFSKRIFSYNWHSILFRFKLYQEHPSPKNRQTLWCNFRLSLSWLFNGGLLFVFTQKICNVVSLSLKEFN